MPYSEFLADRIRQTLEPKRLNYFEKKMFGGLCFMVEDKMCFGVMKEDLMVRVGEAAVEAHSNRVGVRPMDFTKRPMKGYLFIDADGTDMDEDLEFWVDACLAFNPLAKASKKRKKKA